MTLFCEEEIRAASDLWSGVVADLGEARRLIGSVQLSACQYWISSWP